jgi:hypothetical protein
MSYFGGLGSGKGWNKFNFILTPKEFESIFRELKFYFVITNTSVAIDYKATDKAYIFDSYKDFFNEILIGKTALDKKNNGIMRKKSEFLLLMIFIKLTLKKL